MRTPSRTSSRRRARRREADWPRDAQLRQERGRLESALTRMRRAKHPRAHDITEKELRIAEIDRELAQLDADAKARDLIAQSRAFPPDRDPTRAVTDIDAALDELLADGLVEVVGHD